MKAVEFLKDLKAKIDSGAKFEDMARLYSDETETKGFGGKMGIDATMPLKSNEGYKRAINFIKK